MSAGSEKVVSSACATRARISCLWGQREPRSARISAEGSNCMAIISRSWNKDCQSIPRLKCEPSYRLVRNTPTELSFKSLVHGRRDMLAYDLLQGSCTPATYYDQNQPRLISQKRSPPTSKSVFGNGKTPLVGTVEPVYAKMEERSRT